MWTTDIRRLSHASHAMLCYASLGNALLFYVLAMFFYACLCFAMRDALLFSTWLHCDLLLLASLSVAMLSVAALCFAKGCRTMLCYALLCSASLCFALACSASLYFALICFTLLGYALLSVAVLSLAMLCFLMLLTMHFTGFRNL